MTEIADTSIVQVRLADGTPLRGIKKYTIRSSYVTPTDLFDIELAVDTYADTRIQALIELLLEPCEILVDGMSQMLGRIEKITAGSGMLKVSGRDYLSDLVECHVDPTFKISDQAKLGNTLLELCSPIGIDTLLSDGEAAMRNVRTGLGLSGSKNPEFRELNLKDCKAQPGQGIWELAEELAVRHGCSLQPAPSRNALVLCAPNYAQEVVGQLRRSVETGGNVMALEATRDYSSFPTLMMARGKGGAAAEPRSPLNVDYDLAILAENFNTEFARVIDARCITDRIRPGVVGDLNGVYRLHVFDDEQAKTPDQLARSSRRRLSELLRPTLVVSCQVEGHYNPAGGLWGTDTMVMCTDQLTGVNEPLWIQSRDFVDGDGGRATELELWRPATYQL